MNVVDSSAWLEYFADGPLASTFADCIEDVANLVVPSITLARENHQALTPPLFSILHSQFSI